MFEKQRKPGRNKERDKVSTSHITIRVCTDEKIKINEMAKTLGVTQSDFLRDAIMHYADIIQKQKILNA